MNEMKPPPRSDTELKKEAASLGLFVGRSQQLDTPRKKLIKHIWQSSKINRGIGHASILMFGASGVGKSSTINHIFDLKEDGIHFAGTSNSESKTRQTIEFNIVNDDPNFNVKDISLGVVDSQGVGDSKGTRQDVCNIFSIKEFYQDHPIIGNCYPNLIFILIKASDNRFNGPNTSFVKSLKCLSKLNLVDTTHPNVVGVMTHASHLGRKLDIWKSTFEEKRKSLKSIIFKYLHVEADVVALENNADDEGLEIVNDYTELPDGTLQPKNLYDACRCLLDTNKDNYGLIAFNSAFASKKDRISIGFSITAKNASSEYFSKEEDKFLQYLEQTVRGDGNEDPLIRDAHVYIQERNLKETDAREVLKLTSKLKMLNIDKNDASFLSIENLQFYTGLNIGSSILIEYLKHLGIIQKESVNLDDCVRVLAQGYDVLKDRTLPAEILKYDKRNANCGILVPAPAKFSQISQTETIAETFETKDELVKSRLHHLNVGFKVNCNIVSYSSRAGFTRSKSKYTTATLKECSILLEYRLFQVSMANFGELSFKEDFRCAVHNLPAEFVAEDTENINKFERFFDKWGHFVVTQAYGGGSVELKIDTSKMNLGKGKDSHAELVSTVTSEILQATASVSARKGSKDNISHHQILAKSEIKWLGGDIGFHERTTLENPELLSKWKLSLMSYPCMLTTDLCLAPISELVGCIFHEKEDSCYKALEHLLGGKFSTKRSVEKKKENCFNERATTRTEAIFAPKVEEKESCFPGSGLITILKDGAASDIQLKHLQVGSLVQTKNGFSKVLMFAHHAPDKRFTCLKINTVCGHSIRLSANHLIFISSTKQTKMGCEVRPGDKVILHGTDRLAEVISTEKIEEIGFYCPITEDGSLYVDGILSSCYASCRSFAGVDGHYLAHLGLYPARLMNMKSKANQEMHPYIRFLDKFPFPWRG